jgi:hypothetical protein
VEVSCKLLFELSDVLTVTDNRYKVLIIVYLSTDQLSRHSLSNSCATVHYFVISLIKSYLPVAQFFFFFFFILGMFLLSRNFGGTEIALLILV